MTTVATVPTVPDVRAVPPDSVAGVVAMCLSISATITAGQRGRASISRMPNLACSDRDCRPRPARLPICGSEKLILVSFLRWAAGEVIYAQATSLPRIGRRCSSVVRERVRSPCRGCGGAADRYGDYPWQWADGWRYASYVQAGVTDLSCPGSGGCVAVGSTEVGVGRYPLIVAGT
jgi:hypothetical protein